MMPMPKLITNFTLFSGGLVDLLRRVVSSSIGKNHRIETIPSPVVFLSTTKTESRVVENTNMKVIILQWYIPSTVRDNIFFYRTKRSAQNCLQTNSSLFFFGLVFAFFVEFWFDVPSTQRPIQRSAISTAVL
jgi:hypothetical protein